MGQVAAEASAWTPRVLTVPTSNNQGSLSSSGRGRPAPRQWGSVSAGAPGWDGDADVQQVGTGPFESALRRTQAGPGEAEQAHGTVRGLLEASRQSSV